MSKKKTHEEFIQEVFCLVGNEYEVLGNYEKASIKLKIKHVKCNHEWGIQPNAFLKGNRCPICFGTPKKTTEWFKNEVYALVNDEYDVIGEYLSRDKKILILHNKCNKTFEVRPSHFIGRNHRCTHCSQLKQKTQYEFEKEVFELVGDEYSVLGNYKNNRSKVLMKHNVCGNEWEIRASSFINDNQRCAKCANNKKKTTEQFEIEVFELVGNEYEVVGEYEKAIENINMIHRICGNKFEITPNKFLQGRRCPICNSSHGELAIRDVLTKKNFNFKQQYYFDDCRNKYPLPFDFIIFNSNVKMECLIEYDGIQHFEPIEHFGGLENFNYIKHNDQIKNQYCIDNNIPLIRIPYWEFDNIEEILEKEFNSLNVEVV